MMATNEINFDLLSAIPNVISCTINEDDEIECCIKNGLFAGIRYNLLLNQENSSNEKICYEIEIQNKEDLYKYAEKMIEYIATQDMLERLKTRIQG